MDSSVSGKDKIWFLRVCHHVPHQLYIQKPSRFKRLIWTLLPSPKVCQWHSVPHDMPSQYSYLHLQMASMFPSTTKTPGEQALEVWYPKRRLRQSRWRLSLFSVRLEYSTLRLYGNKYPPDVEQRSCYLCFIREFLWWIINVMLSSLLASQRSTYCISYTYLLTPWSRELLEKLTGSQIVKPPPHMEHEGPLPRLQFPPNT